MGRIDETLTFIDTITFLKMPALPAGITNAMVASSAGITQDKLQHQHRLIYRQANVAATAEVQVIFRAYGATGTIIELAVGSIVAATGNSTVTFDLKKNGASVLTSTKNLDNTNTAYVAVLAALTTTAFVAADVLTLHVTISAGSGTLPTGIFAALTVKEDAA